MKWQTRATVGVGRRVASWVILLLAACGHVPARVVQLSPSNPRVRTDGRADLLAGRLSIEPVSGALNHPRAHDIRSAPPSSFDETRVFAESGGARFVVFASELYALTPADLALAVSRSDDLAKQGLVALPFALSDASLHAVGFAPESPEFGGADPEAGLLLGVIVCRADGTLQAVNFLANHAAVKSGCAEFGSSEGCMALARRLAKTIAAGPRELDLGAGPRLIGTVRADLPAGWAVAPQVGEDFLTARIMPMRPLGDKQSGIFMYQGGHPQGARGGPMGSSRLLGKKVSWLGRSGPTGASRTALVELDSAEFIEITEYAQDASELNALDAIVSSFVEERPPN